MGTAVGFKSGYRVVGFAAGSLKKLAVTGSRRADGTQRSVCHVHLDGEWYSIEFDHAGINGPSAWCFTTAKGGDPQTGTHTWVETDVAIELTKEHIWHSGCWPRVQKDPS